MKRLLIPLIMICLMIPASSQNITRAEYFFDNDPGNAVPISIQSPAAVVNITINAPVNSLSPGFHFLTVRMQDANGTWSHNETRGFYIWQSAINSVNITAAEYFFDNDPGNGNGAAIAIGSPGATVNINEPIPVSLSPGFHLLAIRVKDANGKWSLFEKRAFYISSTTGDMPIITAAEYFFDNDPGVGNGSSLVVSNSGNTISQPFSISVPANMTPGDHLLIIRVKDQAGHWSLFERDTLTVGSSAITCPGNVTVTAAEGQCSAIVNNIDAVTSPAGAFYTYTMSGATTGSGTGTVSGKTFNVGVTTVTYALSNSPTTTCSFTVTVNSTIVPSVTISANNTSICTGGTIVFTATPTNGGSTPHYQWKQNGVDVGTDSVILQTNQLNNGDVISVVMTSSIGCASPASATSNSIAVTVTPPYITPTINITASSTSICPGQMVTFTATSTNGGVPWYSWYVNNNWINGPNSDTFQISALANGDKVKCVMTSSLACVTDVTTISNEITMSVGTQPASVTISASDSSICPGQLVTFTATPVNGGSNPQYEWIVNNNAVNIVNSAVYQSSTLQNGDVVRVTMQPFGTCAGSGFASSNPITMSVSANVVPSVTISASAIDICAGTPVTFTATPVNGGITPSYQWKLNGNNVGTNSATYQNSTLNNADTIRVVMTTSLSCASSPSATSNYISMDVTQPVTPSVSIVASSTSICSGQTVTFTATATNAGASSVYQWKINGVAIGTNSNTFQTSSLSNNDVVSVSMTSSLPCVTASTVNSNSISITVMQQLTYYADLDGDGYGNSNSGTMQSCSQPTGYVTNNSDCNDNPATGGTSVHPGASEICGNGIDDDCDGQTDEGCGSPDNDGDGYTVAHGDCNDNNALVHPGATEVCGNGIDDDCDGQTDEGCGSPDNDGDGYTVAQGDCNDNNASVHPGAMEVCGNGIDDDCDGQTDENCTDSLPTLLVKTYPVKEGDAGFTIVNVEVKLDMPAIYPVSVNYATINANAIAGSDYVAANGVLTIPVGAISGVVQLRVIGDLLGEGNESFWLGFSNPINVVLGADPRTRIMIIDDDKGKPNSSSPNNEVMTEAAPFKIPTVVKRGTIWMIPQIGNYENEVLIMNIQGQVVTRIVNYNNHVPIGNIASGIYVYKIRLKDDSSQYKFYSGRLLVTE